MLGGVIAVGVANLAGVNVAIFVHRFTWNAHTNVMTLCLHNIHRTAT